MKLYKLVFVNKIFLKLMLAHCVVIFLGLGIVSYFIDTEMVDILAEKTSTIEEGVLQKVTAYSDSRLRDIRDIFSRMYQPQFFDHNRSIIDYINPDREARIDSDNKFSVITAFLQNICLANSFITDIFIIDYHSEEIFFRSNVSGRYPAADYDFFRHDFLMRENVNTAIEIIPAHIPYHINTFGSNFSVISYNIYLFDRNFISFDRPLGLAVINVKYDFFKEAYRDSSGFQGNIFVIDSDGFCIFDSLGMYSGQAFPFYEYNAENIADLVTNDQYIINKMQSDETGFTFINIVDKQVVAEETNLIRRNIAVIIVICIAITMSVSFFSASMFSRRIKSLVKYMNNVESGMLNTRIAISSDDEIGYLEHSFNTMCAKLEEHIKNVYIFELKTRTAQLKALQAQINPHFLFNTLESIRLAAQMNNDEKVAKMVHILGSMFRWVIGSKEMFVDLEEEVDYINYYMELQMLRNSDAFSFYIDAPCEALKLGVPRLILQPLVENAIQHGLCGKTENAYIRVRVVLSEDKMILSVFDNGIGMDADKIKRVLSGQDTSREESHLNNIGIDNVSQRISILFGDGYGLSISSEKGIGTEVSITIPALLKEEMGRYVQGDNS